MHIKNKTTNIILCIALSFIISLTPTIHIHAEERPLGSSLSEGIRFVKNVVTHPIENGSYLIGRVFGVFFDDTKAREVFDDFSEWYMSTDYEEGVTFEDYVKNSITCDDDGNVTINEDFANNFKTVIDDYIDTNQPYFYLKSYDLKQNGDFFTNSGKTMEEIKTMMSNYETLQEEYYITLGGTSYNTYSSQPRVNMYVTPKNTYFVGGADTGSYTYDRVSTRVYNANLETVDGYYYGSSPYNYLLSPDGQLSSTTAYLGTHIYKNTYNSIDPCKGDNKYLKGNYNAYYSWCTFGKTEVIKVFTSQANLTKYLLGFDDYYISQTYYNDTIQTTYDVKTFNNCPTYNEVKNYATNYDYSTGDTVENITYNYINNYTYVYGDSNTDNNNSSGGTVSGNGDSGSSGGGILAMIEGIGSLLNAIATIFGKVIGLLGDFITNMVNLFDGLTSNFSGFTSFLESAFSFIPAEVISAISLGFTAMIAVAIFKMFKK